MEEKWTVPQRLVPYDEYTVVPGAAEAVINSRPQLSDDPSAAVVGAVLKAQYTLLDDLYEAGLLATPYTQEQHSDIREAIRRTLAHADGVDYDELEEHDYQDQASLLIAMLLTRDVIGIEACDCRKEGTAK